MNPNTVRGLENAVSLLFSAPEFDRVRLFLISDASSGKGESEEIIKYVCDEVRSHLVTHHKAVLAVKRGI